MRFKNFEASTSDSKSSIDWELETEYSTDEDVEDLRVALLETDFRVSISRPDFRKSSRKFYQKIRNSTSTSDSESSSDWEDEAVHDSPPETDCRYSSQESVELGNLDDSSTTLDELIENVFDVAVGNSGDCSTTTWDEFIEDFHAAERSSSTSDIYNSSDDEISSTEEFLDSSSCSNHKDSVVDQSIQRKSINCTCLSPKYADSNTSLQKSTTETVGLARSKEQESEDMDTLFETRGKLDLFNQDNFTNIADTDSTTATTQDSNVNLKTATNADSINEPANFFPENQCRMRMDILIRLKHMLEEIARDNKKYGIEVCTDIEQRITEIITDSENQIKEQIPPELLEKMEDRITHSELDELDGHVFTSKEISRISRLPHWDLNYDDEKTSDSDSSDSSDDRPMDSSEEFKKYFDKYQTFIAQVKLSGGTKLRSWRDDISSQLRENWAESIAYTAETQVILKPGKKIDPNGLKRFGESLEWEVFHRRAANAIEYSNMLCDIHSDIGHGRMSKSEREYLMFLAYKN